jgi:hypothetical protein
MLDLLKELFGEIGRRDRQAGVLTGSDYLDRT